MPATLKISEKAEEVPFLTKKIDVCIAKEFHESLWIIGRGVRVRTT